MLRSFFLSIIFILSFFNFFSQTGPKIDSLRAILKNEKQDTNTVQALYKLCYFLKEDSSLLALSYGKKALELATELDYKKGIASSYNNLGAVYDELNEQEKAIKYFLKSYELKKTLNDYRGLASTLMNIGVIYKRDMNFQQALHYYTLAENYAGRANSTDIFGRINYNMANLYKDLNKNDSALRLYKSLRFNSKLKRDTILQVDVLIGLTSIYENKLKSTLGLAYIDSALQLYRLTNKSKKLPQIYMHKGSCFYYLNVLDSSKICFNKTISIIKDTTDYAFLQQLCYRVSRLHKKLYEKYKKTEDVEMSYKYLDLSFSYREKAFNLKKSVMINDLVLKSEINTMENEIENISHQKEISDLKSKNQKTIIIFICLIAVTILLLLLILYKRFSISKRLNKELEEKNNIIQDKNTEILDSIRYAKRIQIALLPSIKFIERKMKDLKKS